MNQPAPLLEPSSTQTRLPLRWRICGLLFAATVITYIDRQVFSILAPELQRDLGWSELAYGRIVIAFQLSYAAALLLSGRLIDRIGTRLGYTLAFLWWSITEATHALARTALGFGTVRFVVGIGEGAVFPAAIKGIAEWFPESERGMATGLLNCGPTAGAVLAPILVPVTAAHFGWRGAFLLTGALGILWLAGWIVVHRGQPHPQLHTLGRTRPASTAGWTQLLRLRQTWAYATGKILADPAWFFYLFWLPKFLAQQHGLRGTALMPYLTVVYVMTGLGSLCGGWISSRLLRLGWSVNRARKTTLALSALLMPVVIVASGLHNAWPAVLLIGLALAAHQSWSSLVFTVGTDLFPSHAVGAATGIAGAAGSVATIAFAELTGRVLQNDPSAYRPMFVACGSMYLLAFLLMHLLAPKLEPARFD